MSLLLTLLFGLALNGLFLFYDFGLGLFLLIVLYMGYVIYHLQKNKSFTTKKRISLEKGLMIKSILLCFFIIPMILYDMAVFKVLTFMMLPFICALFFLEFSFRDSLKSVMSVVEVALRPLTVFHYFFRDLFKKYLKGKEAFMYIVMGLVIVLPILLVILPLLLSADKIFEQIASNLFGAVNFSAEGVTRFFVTIIICSYIYGQVMLPIKTQQSKKIEAPIEGHAESTIKTQIAMNYVMSTMLLCINLVYGVFVYVQVRYLFLNQGNLPIGVTYANYAREGFFQLLAVSIINLVIVVFMEALSHNRSFSRRFFEGMTLAMTFVLAVSAFYRMSLYEQSYGYTRLRLLVFGFLICLLMLIFLLMLYIIVYHQRIIHIIGVYSIVFYIGFSWFNIDDFVAKKNIDRYMETGKIDAQYLLSLSDDAMKRLYKFDQEYPKVLVDEYGIYPTLGVRLKKTQLIPWQAMNLSTYYVKKLDESVENSLSDED